MAGKEAIQGIQNPSSSVEGLSLTACCRHASASQIDEMPASSPEKFPDRMFWGTGERPLWYAWMVSVKMAVLRLDRTVSFGQAAGRIRP